MEPRPLTSKDVILLEGHGFVYMCEIFKHTEKQIDWHNELQVSIIQFQQPLAFCLSCFIWPTSPYTHSIPVDPLWVCSRFPDRVASLAFSPFSSLVGTLISHLLYQQSPRGEINCYFNKDFWLQLLSCNLTIQPSGIFSIWKIPDGLVIRVPDFSHFSLTLSFSLWRFWWLFILSGRYIN